MHWALGKLSKENIFFAIFDLVHNYTCSFAFQTIQTERLSSFWWNIWKTLMSCIEWGEGHLSKRSTFKVPAAQVQQHFECYNESDGYVDFYVDDDDDDDDNY